MNRHLIAVGRSRYLYDSIKYLSTKGYRFKAIITAEAYQEYDVKHQDFERLAAELGCRFFMTRHLLQKEVEMVIKENKVCAAISANWQYLIPTEFIDLFPCGMLNFHLGNLPDYKGNATVNWTILNGETYINGNIHKMAAELDAGDIVARRAIPIQADTYIADILKQAEAIAPALYEEALQKVFQNPLAYEEKGSRMGLRCFPRLPEDSQIDWNQPVEHIYRLVRASSFPYAGAFSFFNGEKVVVRKAKPVELDDRFLAMPGHVVALLKESNSIVVACQNGLLEVQEIEHQGALKPPASLIKSVRVRFKHKADG